MNQPLQQRVQEMAQRVKKAEHYEIQAKTELESLRKQYQETLDELKALNVDPKQLDATLVAMEKEIGDLMDEINTLLPTNVQA